MITVNDVDIELGVIIHWVHILLEKKMVNCHTSKAKAHKFSKKSKKAREREREEIEPNKGIDERSFS